MFPERNYSSSFTSQFGGKESTAVHQTKEKVDKKVPENDSSKKAEKEQSQTKAQDYSIEHDYKDDIEKEAVEQEKEADDKAEKEGAENQENDYTDGDDDDDDDDDDDVDDDSESDDIKDEDDHHDVDDDNEEEIGHFHKNSMKQDDRINNPADQSFAVSPTVVPGMCPPCRKC